MSLSFSSSLPNYTRIKNRNEFLLKFIKGKKVLHGGCVDAGVMETRLKRGQFLHDYLQEHADHLIGVDLDQEGIDQMKTMGYQNVIFDNLETWETDETFDVIVLGEIIEHVDNCGKFLDSIKRLCNENTIVIFTTPNAYFYLFWLYAILGKESIHPDHNYLFSTISLKTILNKHNYEILEYGMLWSAVDFTNDGDSALIKMAKGAANLAMRVLNLSKYLWPQLGNNLIFVTRINKN